MAKPSIFSRDYEKRMRKRKRRIFSILGIIILVSGVLLYNFKIKNMDFSNMRDKLQAWVDSDDSSEEKEDNIKTEVSEEVPVEEKKTYIEFQLPNKEKVKCEYKEDDKGKIIENLECDKNYTFDISPNKKEALILSPNQDIYYINLDSKDYEKVNEITKKEYISRRGTKFPKDKRLEIDKEYIWHKNPKFIDDNTIIYISQLPYFGTSANKEYLWIYNLNDKSEKTIWKLSGKEIKIGDLVKDKGINIKVDGKDFILNNEGNIEK